MRSRSVRCAVVFLACVTALASAPGCDSNGRDGPVASSETSSCTVQRAGAAWWNQSFAEATGQFHVELTATPSADKIDAVVGVSDGAAAKWSQLAAIVRWSAAGIIDVRKGSTYAADISYPYTAGTTYQVRMDIDIRAHTYSVHVRVYDWEQWKPLARDYPFRTEQAGVTALDNIASYLEPDLPGALEICGITAVQDDSTVGDCLASTAGSGFANIELARADDVLMAHFSATPSEANMDGVIGFSLGDVDSFGDYAVSLRFATNGLIEARDGDVYRAVSPVAYAAGKTYLFAVIVDLASKTYSLQVDRGSEAMYTEIARSYRFRTQQFTVGALDRAATIVDSPTGRLDTCRLANATWADARFARRGYHQVTPLANGDALISDGAETQRLDGNGVTIARGARPGFHAADAAGTIYIANVANETLTLSAYSPALVEQWTRAHAVTGTLVAFGRYANGELAAALRQSGGWLQVVRLRSDGTVASSQTFPHAAVAIGATGFVLARGNDETFVVEAYRPDGTRAWQRSWNGGVNAGYAALDDNGGVVITGEFYDAIDFGDGLMEPYSIPADAGGWGRNVFVLALDATGALRYSERMWVAYPTGIATNGDLVAVSLQQYTQFPYMELAVLDATGTQIWGLGADEENGVTKGIAIGPTGRVFANLGPKRSPSALDDPWPHLFAFDP